MYFYWTRSQWKFYQINKENEAKCIYRVYCHSSEMRFDCYCLSNVMLPLETDESNIFFSHFLIIFSVRATVDIEIRWIWWIWWIDPTKKKENKIKRQFWSQCVRNSLLLRRIPSKINKVIVLLSFKKRKSRAKHLHFVRMAINPFVNCFL